MKGSWPAPWPTDIAIHETPCGRNEVPGMGREEVPMPGGVAEMKKLPAT
jgi:hypothetical protein